ncbi:pilus assembly protein [Actinospica sp. MGRD01-02]|uniref:Pilus assembly protein n=1 Tax=Actinospica acidithermotolerans TaxID=2828514 RepID=A0A941II13_9ACTN|nr:TadE/TadG family type IV pilus assembly protein [Actinospica acidithermotolerans]MBR7827834.1 pilus assembly protein [Actinospica acidithermotolerans]
MPHATPTLRAARAALTTRVRALGRERGAATVELVIAVPALILLLLFIVQFGLIWLAQQCAQTAASSAVNAARAQGANPGLGQSQGQATLKQIAGAELPDASVSVTYTGTTATVVVTGHPQSLIPGWHPQVTAHISAPIETITQP